jgi:hypothetical protein
MKHILHPRLRKHNGLTASVLTLVILISGGLQLVHDHLINHHHTVDCPMFVLDGSAAVPETISLNVVFKQTVEQFAYHPVVLVISQLEKQQARAPPAFL